MTARLVKNRIKRAVTKVVSFYEKGGKFGWDAERGVCALRAPNGGRCAVGVLLADKDYKGEAFQQMAVDVVGERLGLPESFLLSLQTAHDDTVFAGVDQKLSHARKVARFRRQTRELCVQYGVTI